MKKKIYKVVSWMTELSLLAIIIGTFLPFVKWSEGFEEIYTWSFWGVIEGTKEVKYAIILGIALLVTLYVLFSYETAKTLLPVSFFVFVTIVQKIIFRDFGDSFQARVVEDYFFGVGAEIMGGAYVVLVLASIFALCGDIYCILFEEKVQRRLRAKNVLIGGDGSRCPKCGKILMEGSKFCGLCGFDMSQLRCPRCGEQRIGTGQFCPGCGERLPVLVIRGNGEDSSTVLERLSDCKVGRDTANHWVCGKCGEENAKELRHCRNCGSGR